MPVEWAVPSPRPTPENLAAELAAMLRTGITIDGCRQSPAILSLALVRAKASSDDHWSSPVFVDT